MSRSVLDQALAAARSGRAAAAADSLAAVAADTAAPAALRAEALGHRAWILRGLGRPQEAVADYDALLALSPGASATDPSAREVRRQRFTTLATLGGVSPDTIRQAAAGLAAMLVEDPLDHAAALALARAQTAAGATVAQPPPPDHAALGPPPAGPLNAVIHALERHPGSYPTSSFPEAGRLLYALVRAIRPGRVVETGCHIGYSTLCMAQALEENGHGHLDSFDLFPPDSPFDSPVAGPCANVEQAARAHVERAGLTHRVTLHRGDSAAGVTAAFPAPAAGQPGPVDFAFIDGDHSIAGAARDFRAVEPLIAPGGLVALHDTVPDRCGWAGPRHLLEELPRASRGNWQCVNIPTPEGFGMGLMQRAGGDLVGPWRAGLGDMLAERLLWRRHWKK